MSARRWDCHTHVIGDRDRFPLAPEATYTPPEAPVDALIAHLDAIGRDCGVVVQPSVYGFDNSCLLDALRRRGDRLRGIAVPPPEAGPDLLDDLHHAGVRGVRCNLLNAGGLTLEQTRPWWRWMTNHGWHLQIQADATGPDFGAILAAAPDLPLVIDHMGFPPLGRAGAACEALSGPLGAGRIHVKLSAAYRMSAHPPPYPDMVDLARALLGLRPQACLWASDWPHTDSAGCDVDIAAWSEAIFDLPGAGDPMEATAADLYGR